jgi:group I intron endonuclease
MFVFNLDDMALYKYEKLAASHEILNRCGIYKIECLDNRYVYVGGTSVRFIRRWQYHIQNLRNGFHRNKHLQTAYWLYKNFSFSVLEVVESKENLVQKEQKWLDIYQSEDCFLCNIFPADPSIPRPLSTPETRKRRSESNKRLGIKPSPEDSQKAYEINRIRMLGNTYALGKSPSEEVREVLRQKSMGNQHGKGYKHTPEEKEKISQASKRMWEKRKQQNSSEMGVENNG